jgi:AcrR family transcriptional regulator
MTMDTKQRILEVAEELFAEHGLAGTSLRRIIADAGVNLAAVHYYFRSKESLLEAVIVRRTAPLNEERLTLLDRVEREAGRGPASLEDILQAFLGPPIRLILNPTGEGRIFGKLMGRLHSETNICFLEIAKKHFGEVSQRFRAALQAAVPDLPEDDLNWRVHFAMGAMAHTLIFWDRLEVVSHGRLKTDNPDTVIPRLVGFIAAGFRAPVSWKNHATRGPAANGRSGRETKVQPKQKAVLGKQ